MLYTEGRPLEKEVSMAKRSTLIEAERALNKGLSEYFGLMLKAAKEAKTLSDTTAIMKKINEKSDFVIIFPVNILNTIYRTRAEKTEIIDDLLDLYEEIDRYEAIDEAMAMIADSIIRKISGKIETWKQAYDAYQKTYRIEFAYKMAELCNNQNQTWNTSLIVCSRSSPADLVEMMKEKSKKFPVQKKRKPTLFPIKSD